MRASRSDRGLPGTAEGLPGTAEGRPHAVLGSIEKFLRLALAQWGSLVYNITVKFIGRGGTCRCPPGKDDQTWLEKI